MSISHIASIGVFTVILTSFPKGNPTAGMHEAILNELARRAERLHEPAHSLYFEAERRASGKRLGFAKLSKLLRTLRTSLRGGDHARG